MRQDRGTRNGENSSAKIHQKYKGKDGFSRSGRIRSVHLSLLLSLTTLLGRVTSLLAALLASPVHLVEEGQAGSLELVGLLLQLLSSSGDLARLVLGDEFTKARDLLADLVGLGLVQAVLELLKSLLGVIQDAVGTVGSLDGSLARPVLLTVLLSVLNHGLDLSLRKTGTGSDGDGLVLAGRLVLSVHVNNRVGVNVEGDLDLRDTTVSWGDANKLEVSKQLVVLHELTLTLVDLDLHSRLEVGGGREGLGLLRRDRSVAVDETGEDTTQGLDTERQRGNVKQQDVGHLTGKDSTLDGSTNGNGLIRVNGLGRLTTEHVLDRLADLWHTGHTTNQDDILDILGLKVGVLQGLADRLVGTVDERLNQSLQLSTGQLHVDVLGTRGVSSDEGQVDLGLERRRKLNLGLLGRLTDTLDGHAVVGEVNARFLLEVLDDVADQADIKVLTTQVSVTVGGLDLEDSLLDLKDGDIEGTTTQVVNSNHTVALLLKTVGQSSSSRLVDNSEDVETRNLTGVLGGLTLRVVEIGRNSDDTVLDRLAQVVLSGLLHLLQDETTNLSRRVLLTARLNPGITVGVLNDLVGDLLQITLNLRVGVLASDETLRGEQSVLRVHDRLALGGDTDQPLAILSECNDRWRRSCTCRKRKCQQIESRITRRSTSIYSMLLRLWSLEAKNFSHTFSVLNNSGVLSLHHSDGGVGGT